MCALHAQGETETINKLAEKPSVECENCGARANDPQNVCSPRQLPDITWLGDGADVCKNC
jgi:hypothetical protein